VKVKNYTSLLKTKLIQYSLNLLFTVAYIARLIFHNRRHRIRHLHACSCTLCLHANWPVLQVNYNIWQAKVSTEETTVMLWVLCSGHVCNNAFTMHKGVICKQWYTTNMSANCWC